MDSKSQIRHLTEGLYTVPSSAQEKPELIGSKCSFCGEIYFPKKEINFCPHCQKGPLGETRLSQKGIISSFTIVTQKPAGGFYRGPVPYAYGFVDLPEGVRVKTQFKYDFNKLQIGLAVELCIVKLYRDDDGSDVYTYMFKPASVRESN